MCFLVYPLVSYSNEPAIKLPITTYRVPISYEFTKIDSDRYYKAIGLAPEARLNGVSSQAIEDLPRNFWNRAQEKIANQDISKYAYFEKCWKPDETQTEKNQYLSSDASLKILLNRFECQT